MNLENRPPTPNQETVGQHFSKRYVCIYTTSCTCPDTIGIVLYVCSCLCVCGQTHAYLSVSKAFLSDFSPDTVVVFFVVIMDTGNSRCYLPQQLAVGYAILASMYVQIHILIHTYLVFRISLSFGHFSLRICSFILT